MSKNNKAINTTAQLMNVIQESGGTVGTQILDLTVAQFITDIAAPNNITFHHHKEDNEKYHNKSYCEINKRNKKLENLTQILIDFIRKNGKDLNMTINTTEKELSHIPVTDGTLVKCEKVVTMIIPYNKVVKQ